MPAAAHARLTLPDDQLADATTAGVWAWSQHMLAAAQFARDGVAEHLAVSRRFLVQRFEQPDRLTDQILVRLRDYDIVIRISFAPLCGTVV